MDKIEWYSSKTQQGWISTDQADILFPSKTWEELGFECIYEFVTPEGFIFTYIRKYEW